MGDHPGTAVGLFRSCSSLVLGCSWGDSPLLQRGDTGEPAKGGGWAGDHLANGQNSGWVRQGVYGSCCLVVSNLVGDCQLKTAVPCTHGFTTDRIAVLSRVRLEKTVGSPQE